MSNSLFSFSVRSIHFPSSEIPVSCDFQVDTGIVHLLGGNGVGKTSLLQSIVGILDFKGHGELAGKNIKKMSPEDKRIMSYCPDQYLFSSDLSPLEYLEFVSLSYGIKPNKKKYLSFISKLGVSEGLLNRKIKDLSYGTIKKVLIAAAFLPEAKLVLMDEPINGLDQVGKRVLSEYIRKQLKKTVFIIVCHDEEWMNQYDPVKFQIS